MGIIYYKVFDVDPKFISDGVIKWKWSSNGEYIVATNKGKKNFVKRNTSVLYPAPTDSTAVKEKKIKSVKELERKQESLRRLMRGLDPFKDRIVVEEMSFRDNDFHFTTVTAFIPDTLHDEYKYNILDENQFIDISIKMAKNMVLLHERGVIHGDLKEKNILVKKNGSEYIPYLIDFDTSFPASEIPKPKDDGEDICGTSGYHSPELLTYGKLDDSAAITTATDIFSLGVVMHRWWTGSFPSVDFEKPWVGAAVYLGKKVTINKKFNVVIGPNNEATICSLLLWMFAKEPSVRPTAKEVVAVLSDEIEVPDEYCTNNDKVKFDKELWSAHILIAELDNVAALRKKNLKSFKRINDGSGSSGLKYFVKYKDGKEATLTIDEVIKLGFCTRKDIIINKPWDDHFIKFISADKISEKGYSKIERIELNYKKRYLLTTTGGRTIDKSVDWLLSEGLAMPQKAEVESDSPWPEDGTAYNLENMAKCGVVKISRVEIGGKHAYQYMNKDGKTTPPVPAKNLAIMGFFKK